MKYLKTFENFDFGDRFSGVESDEQEWLTHLKKDNDLENSEEEEEEDDDCAPCRTEEEEEESDMQYKPKVWGDEVVEGKKAKPDFLDLDKDGDKKESMKKAAKDAKEKGSKKEDKKEDKKKEDKKEDTKGLSASQKKLPAGLQKAILAKKNK